MSTGTPAVRPRRYRAAVGAQQWRRLAPAHRDGLSLVLSSALTSGVGLLYWVLAARLFAPEVLGVDSVALSTMMLLAGVGQLNLNYALLRFVPVAGRAAARLVLGGYLVAALSTALVGAGFALGAPLWAPELAVAFGPGPLVVFFAVATPVWAVFMMQDFVLTAIRRAAVVPAENFAFSLLKIAALAAAVLGTTTGGGAGRVAVSWVAATVVVVLVVNGWLLARALPRFAAANDTAAVPITRGALTRFLRADYAGAVLWQTALFGLPVLVLARLGPADAAVYGVVWTLTQALYLVSSGMGQSMVAHSAATAAGSSAAGSDAARRAVIRRSLVLVGPVAVVLAAGAPLWLSVFGAHYAQTGALALMLAALSAVPNTVTAATVAAARVRGRSGVQFGVPATVSVLTLVLSWMLMPRLGVTAVGLAWLAAQTLVAGGLLLSVALWLLPRLAAGVGALRVAVLLRRVRGGVTVGRADWVLGERLVGRSDSVVVSFGPVDGPGTLLKAADSDKGRALLRRQTGVLRDLHADRRLGGWRDMVPSVLGDEEVGGSYCVLESRLDGHGGHAALTDPARRRTFQASAVATIGELHQRSARPVVVGEEQLRRWVHEPMAEVLVALPRPLRPVARALAEELAGRLRGRRVATGWTHGDFGPENVLTDPDGRVVAVVDWCHAEDDGLPVLDVVCFGLVAEVLSTGVELGALVLDRVADRRPAEHDLLARMQRMLGAEVLDTGLLVLLAWLQHVGHNLEKSPGFAANPVWSRRNLVAVVRGAPALLAARPHPGGDGPVDEPVTVPFPAVPATAPIEVLEARRPA